SGTMEGKEMSPSHHSEESSILDLPSVCDLAEHFLPPHSSENSEELFHSVDTFPSPPTGVSTVPVEKDHIEEMVTRCIVEVLSNALSKPNAPLINPECKEILKKSGGKDRERSENNQLEVRHLKDPAETEKQNSGNVEKQQSQTEEESKKYMGGIEKLAQEEGKSKEEENGHHTPIQEERLHTEEKKHYQEIRREEEKGYHSEEESKESKRHDEDGEHAIVNKKFRSGGTSTEEFPDQDDQHPKGHWHSEKGMQSPYKRIHEGEGEAEEERSEKYHHESKEHDFSHQQEYEESDESEETEDKRQPYKPTRYHGKHRMGDSSEEKRAHGGEKEEPSEESNTEEALLWDKRNNHQKHHEESEQQHEEKSGYRGRRGSEEVEDKRPADQGSEEYRERWQQSEESSEEENKRHHHSEESNEKWHEERRHRDGSHETRRHHSEVRTYRGDGSEEELGRYLSGGSKEKQRGARERYHLWDNEDEGSEKAYAREHKGQARRHHSTEDSVEQQRYPGNSEEEEEEVEKKRHSSDQMENEEENMEEGRYTEREEYRSRLPAENEKRTTASYSPFYPLLRWKSRHFEKRDSAGEQLLESKEEGRPTPNEKSLFPEYTDYDWWEKKQILSALNHGRTEKRNLGKMNRYDMKRQYNKVDQLAQLLNYRKKSAEFPELYNSGEEVKKHHVTRNNRGGLSQRPLTEEEEKELENLAAMDLELQKIAQKFNDNRRG
ncbi:SCG1 protein, partial [Psophia crepitans]|nr:SCG1 protein [Psophia crepitans]